MNKQKILLYINKKFTKYLIIIILLNYILEYIINILYKH